MRNLLENENMGHRLPINGAPNKALLKSVTAVNTMRAAQLRSTIFVRKALLRPDASVIRKTIAKCNDPTVKCWMRMMSGTYPVNAYLYRIKKVKSPNCAFCDRGDRKHYLTFSRCALNSIMLEPQRTTGYSSCFRDMPQHTGILSRKLICI